MTHNLETNSDTTQSGRSLAASAGSSPWSPSHREEVISALWFIVAFVALDAGCPRWVFLSFFIKACLDSLCAIKCAVSEWWREDSGTNDQV